MNGINAAERKRKIAWPMLAFMVFSTVWGFGNVTNGFMYFGGIQVIFSWILMFALYFVPYTLMVGELGSAFKQSGGGVSSWIQGTYGNKMAYYAGWTYWAVHIAYIASKGSGGLKALSWAIFRNAQVYDELPTLSVQLATLAVLLLFCYIASRGVRVLKGITTLAGSTMFIMSILFILMMFAAPVINPGGGFVAMDFHLKNLIPRFDAHYFTSLSILVFAVGGCEKISPYVNRVDEPSRNFPRSMILLAGMVVVCAILGTIALGMMFDPAVIGATDASFNSYVSNGAYWAFQKLGRYYRVGDFFLIIYAVCNAIGQFSTLVISIDAPLRILLGNDSARDYVPGALLRRNRHGAYLNGIRLVAALSGAIILAQILVPGAAAVLTQLTKLNSVCMPLRYLWVFVAYIGLRRNADRAPAGYRFVKSRTLALFFGYWCAFVTAACCILGMYSRDPFTMLLNIITPCALVALGMIMPCLARRERTRER